MVRLKTRYLLVDVVPAANARKLAIQKEDVAGLIKDSIARNYGDYGVGLLQYAFQVLYFNKHTRFAVVRCAREQCKLVESSLVFVTECQSQEVKIRVARVCGMRSARIASWLYGDRHADVGSGIDVVAGVVCAGSSRTCREHLLKFSIERAETLNLKSVYPDYPKELEDEIALIDPQ